MGKDLRRSIMWCLSILCGHSVTVENVAALSLSESDAQAILRLCTSALTEIARDSRLGDDATLIHILTIQTHLLEWYPADVLLTAQQVFEQMFAIVSQPWRSIDGRKVRNKRITHEKLQESQCTLKGIFADGRCNFCQSRVQRWQYYSGFSCFRRASLI